jgi:glycosyltransferase involved in cell wall biosynthesis
VVIPSRTGRDLLAAQLPGILAEAPDQIIVVDNGSTDDTAAWLRSTYPQVEVEHSPAAFSRAPQSQHRPRAHRMSAC